MNTSLVQGPARICLECLKLRQQARRASSGVGSSSTFRNRNPAEDNAAARFSSNWDKRRRPVEVQRDWNSPNARPARPSSAGPGQDRARPPLRGRPASSQNYEKSMNVKQGKQRQASAPPPKNNYESATVKTNTAPRQINYAQGSALSAFLAKSSSAKADRQASAQPMPNPAQRTPPAATKPIEVRRKPRLARQARRPRKRLEIPSVTSVATLASIMGLKLRRLQLLMERMGMTDNRPDRLLNSEDASLVAVELGYDAVVDEVAAFDIFPALPPSDPSTLPLRPPIVTIMGHVDHGKTSLLDALRSTSVAAGEAGGITQHIGAFSVPLSSLLSGFDATSTTSTGSITFLDTPGHAAFTAMRSRGASVTDVVVLVVAADDGVKPQTEEVIKLIRNEDVGVVVAITKCDKPGIDIHRVHNELMVHGLEVEALGGDIPCVEVSAHAGTGLPDLVETINVIAEVRDLRAEASGVPSEARVIESRVDKGRGNIATIIVTRGTLKTGCNIIAGTSFGRVRQLTRSDGTVIDEATPGTPVEITGWKDLPEAGDEVLEAASEDDAKKAIANRKRKIEQRKELGDLDAINEKRRIESEAATLLKRMQEEAKAAGEDPAQVYAPDTAQASGPKQLRLIVKADFSGTVEAVANSLAEIGNHEAQVKVVSTGVGEVTDSDLTMAKAVDGVVVCFNVKASRSIMSTAASLNVPILVNDVIYRLIDEVKDKVIDLLPKQYDTRVLGEATIQQVFSYNLKGVGAIKVAGCRVTNGSLQKKAKIRVLRNKEVIFSGNIESLKHVKESIEEARKGSECGLNLEGFSDFEEGDTLQSFEETLRIRTL